MPGVHAVLGTGSPPSARGLLIVGLACGAGYGAVMGSFAGRPLQACYAALKVPLLLGVTFALSVPSFFVLSSLMGLRADARPSLTAHLRAQACLSVFLLAFAPYTALFYASSSSYTGALLFNAAMFGLASLCAQGVLRFRLYRRLLVSNPRHRLGLRLWLAIYAFVGIQMGWVLRPFVGSPTSPVAFFREGAWGNAYLVVLGLVRQALGS